jgi:hypothetical protein
MRPPPLKHASKYGVITLRFRKRSRTLTYAQKGGNQSTADCNGVSLDAHIHVLYGLTLQRPGKNVLMIGCGGGTLGTMLARAGRQVSIVEIDPVSFRLAKRYFGLPRNIACQVGDGLAFMQKTRRRYDVVIVDAFTGENIPAHMKGVAFFEAAAAVFERTAAPWSMFVWSESQTRLPIGLPRDSKKEVGPFAFWIARVANATLSFWRDRWATYAGQDY